MDARQELVVNSAACVNILTIIIRWLVALRANVSIGAELLFSLGWCESRNQK